ncbi:Hypothetical predicted protein [Olea europaea subsp. europaea]|uniref:Uncharacterized protein n=1 Tax=Olea europaea subsp. europaea TaxID=158383 RepID=A0A8S0U5L4_OLEEU|nr:Hypothetical predicted protein [Olea europaea subsp. europaea]
MKTREIFELFVSKFGKEDIPFIKCQVCEKFASHLYHQVQAKQTEISPKNISEYQIIEIAENVSNLKKQEADWILKIDIVEQVFLLWNSSIQLVEQDSEGQCSSELKTIERACQLVWFLNFICKDLTKAFSKKPPPVAKDRTPREPFIAKSSKEAEMDKLLKSMEGMPGAPSMKMYSREDLMNMKNMGDEDAEDEDEDEEPDFPSKLGKVLGEKDGKNYDWKQRIINGPKESRMQARN